MGREDIYRLTFVSHPDAFIVEGTCSPNATVVERMLFLLRLLELVTVYFYFVFSAF